MGNIFYVNGEYLPEDKATIPVNDLSVLRGYGVFDYFRTYQGVPFHIHDHLQRLQGSAQSIGMDRLPKSIDEIHEIVLETLSRNNHAESGIRIVVTGGISPDNLIPQGNSNLLIMITPVKPMPANWYTEGAKVITLPTERFIPTAKSIDYIPAIMGLQQAKTQNAIEAIYTDRDGVVREGTTSSLFFFQDNTLVTTQDNILPGVTRQVVLEITQDVFPIEIRNFTVDELEQADAVFITSSTREVVPIIQVNDAQIADGTVQPNVQKVMQLFRAETERFVQMETVL